MKIIVKERYKKELNIEVIKKVLTSLNLNETFEVEYIKGDGRNLVIETDSHKYYVIVSRETADARNAFLAQYISTVLGQYIEDLTTKQKNLNIFLLDTSDKAKTDFIIDTYRIAKTLGISILNENDLKLSPIQPYNSFKDWKNARNNRQQYNPANQSSYAMEDEDEYTVFGKLYGANGKESAFLACQLAEIAKKENKKLNFVQVKEHGTESISSSDKKLLEYYGVNISNGSIVLKDKQIRDRSTCRKQDEFKFNLLEKYGNKKCYLCDCDIESNIIASHIHRITDIDNSNLSDEEKRRQAVDGNNGLWLCANHDKMFEYGIITFNTKGELIINPSLKTNQIEYIKYITQVLKIQDIHLTNEFLQYLTIHNKRVKLGL